MLDHIHKLIRNAQPYVRAEQGYSSSIEYFLHSVAPVFEYASFFARVKIGSKNGNPFRWRLCYFFVAEIFISAYAQRSRGRSTTGNLDKRNKNEGVSLLESCVHARKSVGN